MDCTVFLPGNDDDDDEEEEEEENDNDIERIMGLGMVPKTESVWGRGPPIRNFFWGGNKFP